MKDDNAKNNSSKTGTFDVPQSCHLASDSKENDEVLVDHEYAPQLQDWSSLI